MRYSRLRTDFILFMLFIPALICGQSVATEIPETARALPAAHEMNDGGLLPQYSLSDCIQRTLTVSPKISAADYEVKKAQSEIGTQRGNFFPTLSAQTYAQQITSINTDGPADDDYIDQDINVLDFKLSQTLFQGFTIFNAYQKALLNKTLAEARKKQVTMDLVLEVQTNFLKLMKAREDMRSYESAVERLEVNRKAVKAYYEKQMAPYLSVLQADVELADARQLLSKAKNQMQNQQVILNILMGFPAEKQVTYVGQLSADPLDFDKSMMECLGCALENRPEMEISDISLEMAKKELAIQSGQFSPKITASADYYVRNNYYDAKARNAMGQEYSQDQENEYWTAMIQLQWDFNLGGRQIYQRAKAGHDLSRLQQNQKITRDQITAQVQMSYTSLLEARERIAFSQTALNSALEGYDRAQKRYQVQMGTIAELLDIQASLTRAEANCNQAIVDYQLSLANLIYAIGMQDTGVDEKIH